MEMTVATASDKEEIIADTEGKDIRFLESGAWKQFTPEAVGKVSAVALAFACERAHSTGRPVSVAVASRGGTRIESWLPKEVLSESEYGRRQLSFLENPEVLRAAEEDRRVFRPYDQTKLSRWKLGRALPGELYESHLVPLKNISFDGFIWYQGESNAEDPEDSVRYENQLGSMIVSLRKLYGKNIPGVVIGLPRYEIDESTRKNWDLLRSSQQGAAGRAHQVAYVDIFEYGDPLDIHPKRKRSVGIAAARALRSFI